jgi:APA family basic amino acid/polyamine antiporter
MASIGAALPPELVAGPDAGGILNLPAMFIIAVVAGMLIYGTRESANLNAVLVVVKLLALAMFIMVALPAFNSENLTPFMPYGFPKSGPAGSEVGVMSAAAIIFFAFYGFDAIATAAEEAKDPDRDLAIGIVGSMIVCVALYMAVAAVAVGALVYTRFADSAEPLALILRELGQGGAAQILGVSAVVTLPTVILAFFFGQSRIFFTMARDGLLPTALARVSKRKTPVRITIFTGLVVAVIAGLFPLADIAALANAGTLTAFIAVAAAMLAMRRREPDKPRRFSTPLPWVVGIGAILGCLYLFWSLPVKTQTYFLIWNLGGLVLYWLYGSPRAEKARAGAQRLR